MLQARLRATLPPEYAYLSHSTYSLPDSDVRNNPGVLDAYMAASHAVFILQVPLIGLCFLGTAFIRDRGLEPPEDKALRESLRTGGDEEQGAEPEQMTVPRTNDETEKARESNPPLENATENTTENTTGESSRAEKSAQV